ncbi:MAG TPA: FliM/FliN family flagellar motor switch protein, partial [Synergistaceae bacterium]|nr:FliM/FliN family flagellar motor switch protein [Synergistaceae bacterium]
GIINLCIPYIVMEPMVDKLSSQHWFASTGRKSTEGSREALARKMQHVSVPLALELGHSVLSLQDVLGLQVGDVIRLDGTAKDPIGVRVGNRVKFLASPGKIKGAFGAKIVKVLSEDEGAMLREREEE